MRSRSLVFCALASGSKGNAVFVGSETRGVLVDAGLPRREMERRLAAVGRGPGDVAAVVVTHDHWDHIRGVGAWARRYGVPVYVPESSGCSAEKWWGRRECGGVDVRPFASGYGFEIEGLSFLPFSTPHDAPQSVGFRVTDGAAVLGFATDLGFVSPEVRNALQGVDILYVESNHDEGLLMGGPYPAFLKKRIVSDLGHLSNESCRQVVAQVLHRGLRAVVLGHVSEVNNEPRLAFRTVQGVLEAAGAKEDVTLLVARQDRPGRVLRT